MQIIPPIDSHPYSAWRRWLDLPTGQQLLALEQAWLDAAVGDCFGYQAIQVGPSSLDALRKNRMGHRTRLCFKAPQQDRLESDQDQSMVVGQADAWPFASESVDLVVLVHGLEVVEDPHGLLREAERVLIPEGRLVLVGLNPMSLWALHRPLSPVQFPPVLSRWVAMGRVKDWCALLALQVEGGRHGFYRPVSGSARRLERLAWMEDAGARWWPGFGALYQLTAVKRRVGMRVILPQWRAKAASSAKPVAPTVQQLDPGQHG